MSDNPIPQAQSSAAIPHNRWRRRLTKWLRHGNLIVTGKHEHETFTVIARYGWHPCASA